jgi:predicted alpha/beta hydrolase family esterase
VRSVLPMSRDDLALEPRLAAIEREAHAIHGPIVVVAHSGGCIALAHWARRTTRSVHGALLAAPPEFDRALPEGYPSIDELRAAGWLAVPREPLPFPSIVAASRTDPLARFEGIEALAHAWGSRLVDLGDAGHLNPASGYGPWPRAEDFIRELAQAETEEPAR